MYVTLINECVFPSRSWRQPSEIPNSKRPGGSDSGGSKLSQEKVNTKYIHVL